MDVSEILKEILGYEPAGELILNSLVKTASRKLTAAEILGHQELAITCLWKSL